MEIIELQTNLGEFFLLKEDGLLDAETFRAQSKLSPASIDQLLEVSTHHHQFLFGESNNNAIGVVIKRHGEIKINLVDGPTLSGFDLVYEKPAKGGGIIHLSCRYRGGKASFLYGYVNLKRKAPGSWDYDEWEAKVQDFETNILQTLKDWTGKPVLTQEEYFNC